MENKHTPTPPKDEAIFPIKVNAKPNSKNALKLAQSIMVKLAEKKEMENNTANRMKTAEITLENHLLKAGVNIFAFNVASCRGVILEAMRSHANEETVNLTTQLAKANSDKEKLGEQLKEENEELKRLLVQILKLDIQEDYYKMHIVEPINDLLTKHSK